MHAVVRVTPASSQMAGPKISCDDLHVINFCSKIFNFHSAEITTPGIWCHSSIKFDRLRPFPTIHGVFAIFVPFFGVSQFDRVRRSSIKFESIISLRRAAQDIHRIFLVISTCYFLETTLSPTRRPLGLFLHFGSAVITQENLFKKFT